LIFWGLFIRIGLDVKVGIAVSIAFPLRTELDLLDVGKRTARGPEPLLHHVHLGGSSLDVALHGAPAGVHAPSPETQGLGLPQGVPPEVDSLHLAEYLELAGMNTLGRHSARKHTILGLLAETKGL